MTDSVHISGGVQLDPNGTDGINAGVEGGGSGGDGGGCGITDAYGRVVAGDWGMSDAQIPWVQMNHDVPGATPGVEYDVDGIGGTFLVTNTSTEDGSIDLILPPPPGGIIEVQFIISDYTTGDFLGWMNFDSPGALSGNYIYFDDTVVGAGEIGIRDGVTVTFPWSFDGRPFYVAAQITPAGTAAKAWYVGDPEPLFAAAALPGSRAGLLYAISFESDSGGLGMTWKVSDLRVSIGTGEAKQDINACTCTDVVIHDEFTRTTSNGFGGPTAAATLPGTIFPTWLAAGSNVSTNGSQGVIHGSRPSFPVSVSELPFGLGMNSIDMFIVAICTRNPQTGDIVQFFSGGVAPDVALGVTTNVLSGVGGTDSAPQTLSWTDEFRIRFVGTVGGTMDVTFWNSLFSEPSAQLTIPCDSTEMFDKVSIRLSVGAGNADIDLQITDIYIGGTVCAEPGGGGGGGGGGGTAEPMTYLQGSVTVQPA